MKIFLKEVVVPTLVAMGLIVVVLGVIVGGTILAAQ